MSARLGIGGGRGGGAASPCHA